MRFPFSRKALGISALVALIPTSLAMGPSYFHIRKPVQKDQWDQGKPHAVTWVHAVDNIDMIDIEFARLSTAGLLFAARDVPTRWGALNIELNGVPPGDDYFVVCLNATNGIVYSISDPFSILPPSSSSSTDPNAIAPDPSKPTVTVTGTPNPTQQWAQTFGPQAAGAMSLVHGDHHIGRSIASAVLCTFVGALAGTAWIVL
ncbi:hypothetical protein FRC02_004454 [Tulasnella sp. 418]|nr:hypothetical protein FRC02_004454 [Tulasnella sp. 418]